ncbi:MAG: AfsR/SARP family transcriptional regulator [Acidimicrobiales bacterium]
MRVHVLGRISIEGPSGLVDESELPGSLGRVALVSLVLAHGPISRDALADTLWGDDLPAEWGASLSATLSKIRTALARAGVDRSRLTTTSGAIELTLPAGAWVDLEDGIRRLDRAESSLRHDDVIPALIDATVSSSILARSFLPGVDHRWIDEIRRDVVNRRVRSLEVLADGWRLEGDPQLAYTAARLIIGIDPISEHGYRLAMEACLAMGEHGRCRQIYDECCETLFRELGVEPSPETSALGRVADA